MRGRLAVSMLAIVGCAGVSLADEPVVKITAHGGETDESPRSRLEPGMYAVTNAEIRHLIADAWNADVRNVRVDFGAEEHGDDLFNVTIALPGADAQAIRDELRKAVEGLVNATFLVEDREETVYYLSAADPARLHPTKAGPWEESSSMSNRDDHQHFDIACVNCSAMGLATLVDLTMPSPRLVPTGALVELPAAGAELHFDFTCENCTVESLLTYLRDEHGFTVTPKEETVRYVQARAKPEEKN